MENKRIGLALHIFFVLLIVALGAWGVWGHWKCHNVKGDLRQAHDEIVRARSTGNQIKFALDQLIELSGKDRRIITDLRGELEKAAEYRRERDQVDRELGRVSERGKDDILECLGIADELRQGLGEIRGELGALTEEPDF